MARAAADHASVELYRPVLPSTDDAHADQGDPYVLTVPETVDARFRHYAYHTDVSFDAERAFQVYGSDDLRSFTSLGKVMPADAPSYRWAPCVRWNGERFVMFYSRSTPGQPNHDIGHRIRCATAASPEGPFHDEGEIALPDEVEFAIDADVYLEGGTAKLAFATEHWDGPFVGVGIAEVSLRDDLSDVVGEPRWIGLPAFEAQRYEARRQMPWRTGVGVDWAAGETVDWYCIEAPVGGLRSPDGSRCMLYSCGNYRDATYAIGAFLERDGEYVDLASEGHFVLSSGRVPGLTGAGHPSRVTPDLLVAHGRFGDDPRRVAFFAPLAWDGAGRPYCPVPHPQSEQASNSATP